MDGGVSGPEDDKPLGNWLLRGRSAIRDPRAAYSVLVAFDTAKDAVEWARREGVVIDALMYRDRGLETVGCTCLLAFRRSNVKVRLGFHHPDCEVTQTRIRYEEGKRMERELPKYQSHKVVSALKIGAMDIRPTGEVEISPADLGYSAFTASAAFAARIGAAGRSGEDRGYYVRYSNGFESWSPSKAFEEGYTPADHGPAQKEAVHQALPVKGYSPQNSTATDAVNANKVLEEQCLRQLDQLGADVRLEPDARSLALARTKLQEAFMWANRAVFKPKRIDL